MLNEQLDDEQSTDDVKPRIVSSEDVCGGAARLLGTRIPVWVIEHCKRLEMNETEILEDYPSLTLADLRSAWEYARMHPEEIDRDICENEE